ncbi:hypothetical protein [Amycolatopsis sp. NPDC059657]|uniref:hypothetical protein n=1 Tax=Amycolatopsis sp. NPDC059657 TaxID=3346899 RepID=UPI0036733A08
MWEVVLGEVAKVVTTGMLGGIKDLVVKKLAKRAQGDDLRLLLADEDRLKAALDELVKTEPELGGRFEQLLLEASPGPRPSSDMPSAAPNFVDRDDAREEAAKPGVHVISGPQGSGKSALVYRLAADLSTSYPDQIYVDLAEFRVDNSLRRTEVAAHILQRLGVHGSLISGSAAELWPQYRSLTARRKLLLALDNAETIGDVRGLIPSSPSSLVLVTAIRPGDDLRSEYPGMPIELGALSEADALKLLGHEGPSAIELVNLCDCMPFAVLQAAVRVNKRARLGGDPVRSVLDEFRATGVLGGLDVVATAFERTFAELSPDAAELCTLLASHPGPDFTQATARAVLGRPAGTALDELIDSGFVLAAARPKLYNLVREGARRLGTRDAAVERSLDFHRDQAVAADLSLGKDRLRRYEVFEPAAVDFEGKQPLDWVEDARETYGALAREAFARGKDVELGQICGALETLMLNRGHQRLFVQINHWGIRSAERLGDHALEARILSQQGRAHFLLHEFDRAQPFLDRARELVRPLDDPGLESSVLEFCGRFHEEKREYQPATDLLWRAVLLDRNMAEAGSRALGLHTRMLANVLVKSGRPQDAFGLLEESKANTREPRNISRVLTVWTKALIAVGSLDAAEQTLRDAWSLAGQVGATQYATELHETAAALAAARGDWATTADQWQQAWQILWAAGHPRQAEFHAKLMAAGRR